MHITKSLILILSLAVTCSYAVSTHAPALQNPKKPTGQHPAKRKKELSFDSICQRTEALGTLQDSIAEQFETISQAKKKYQESQSALMQLKKELAAISSDKQKMQIDSSINYSFLDSFVKEREKEEKILQIKLDSLNHEQKIYSEKVYLPKLKKVKGAFRIKDKRNQSYRVYIVDTTVNTVGMHWKNNKGIIYTSLGAVVQDAGKGKILMATNGGMFIQGEIPKGLYIENGNLLQKLDTTAPSNQTANFYLLPNGVFYITNNGHMHIDTTQAFKNNVNTKAVRFATQSGPMLVSNGKINQHFKKGSKNLNIRSGVGVTADGRAVFIISDEQVNFYDFAALFKYNFGCKNALFLDGAISKMYLSDLSPRELGGSFGVIITVSKK